MKKRKAVLWLSLSLLLFSSCGNEAVQGVNNVKEDGNNVDAVENEKSTEENTDTDSEPADLDDTKAANEEKAESKLEEKSFSETKEELEGMVQSVSKDSVVISRIFSGESEEDGLYYAFSPGEGSDEEELVTVYVTGDTKYQFKTIKNGGEDVTEREGNFTDIEKDFMIKVTGYMDDAGKEMKAAEIVIMEVIS